MEEWWPEGIEALEAVRWQTPPGSKTLAADYYELQIRYYAHRPVVYSWKDGGTLAYSNHAELIKWYEKYKEMEAINAEKDADIKLRALLGLSRKLEAQYLLINFAVNPDVANSSGADVIWTNKTFALLKVKSL